MKAKAISIIVVLALCLSLVSVLTPPFSGPVRAATTWYVGPGESIQSIQTAVDAASPGDTIIVRDGTYIENVLVDKGLTIRELAEEIGIHKFTLYNWEIRGKVPRIKELKERLISSVEGAGRFLNA